MSEPSYMDELRDAYYDLYDFAEEFVVNGTVTGFTTEEAEDEFYEVSDRLEKDGYTEEEIDYLSYIAIADAITDAYQEKLLRGHYDHDKET